MHRLPVVRGIVIHDVEEGRCHMNFSEWDRGNEDAWEAPEVVADGEMPLAAYLRHHKDARLTDDERLRLAEGLLDTFAQDPPLDGDACDDDREDRGDDDREDCGDDDDDDGEVEDDRPPRGADTGW